MINTETNKFIEHLAYTNTCLNLRDVQEHGCESGVIAEVVYTDDCKRLYDEYKSEIDTILSENEEIINPIMMWQTDAKEKSVYQAIELVAQDALRLRVSFVTGRSIFTDFGLTLDDVELDRIDDAIDAKIYLSKK